VLPALPMTYESQKKVSFKKKVTQKNEEITADPMLVCTADLMFIRTADLF
jgi:hypothetical protein